MGFNSGFKGLKQDKGDSLGAGRSGERTPVGVRFSAPVQTSPGPHSAFYTMSTRSFPGVKR